MLITYHTSVVISECCFSRAARYHFRCNFFDWTLMYFCLVFSLVLQGHDIKPVHCLISNNQGEIYLIPQPGASITLNDRRIDQPARLSQGWTSCCLHIFIWNSPGCSRRLAYSPSYKISLAPLLLINLFVFFTSDFSPKSCWVSHLTTDGPKSCCVTQVKLISTSLLIPYCRKSLQFLRYFWAHFEFAISPSVSNVEEKFYHRLMGKGGILTIYCTCTCTFC